MASGWRRRQGWYRGQGCGVRVWLEVQCGLVDSEHFELPHDGDVDGGDERLGTLDDLPEVGPLGHVPRRVEGLDHLPKGMPSGCER